MIKYTLLLAAIMATSLQADEIPTVTPVAELRDYSNTLQTRTAQIEHVLGINSTSWLCHLPKGFLVKLCWWQTGTDKPLWITEFKTDDLPQTDGYFLTLFEQNPVSTPAGDRSPGNVKIGFSTPRQQMITNYDYRGSRNISYGTDPKVGKETELWSVSASLEGPPQKYFWMTILITKP